MIRVLKEKVKKGYTKGEYLRMIILFILLISLVLLAMQFSNLTLDEILAYTPESLVLTTFWLIGVYCFKAITMIIPLKILYLLAGIIFPTGFAIAITYLCLYIEATVGFFLGKQLGSERVYSLINKNEKAKHIMEFSTSNSVMSSCFVRFLPLPNDLISLFMGVTKIKYPPYILGTLLGLSPGMLPVILMGESVENPLSASFLVPLVIATTISLSTIFIYKKIRKANKSK